MEGREDANARSIELSLKPKAWKRDPKEKPNTPANPAKAAPAKEAPAAVADVSSKGDGKVKVRRKMKSERKR